mmetsp:Transcript_13131/g.36991  ORF Transcript_13131/g.36991 Transcript_13131/m.36991 type:complete len:201 (+) Transcript_13131:399-1001(+)
MLKRRKVGPEGPRLYAWQEDGCEGLAKARVKDPDVGVGWKKFTARTLTPYKAKRLRQFFRVPSGLFWEMLDKATVAIGWKSGNLYGTGRQVGRGSPIPLAYKMMAFLRVLATGSGFEGYVETTGCNRAVNQQFFHKFASWIVTHYQVFVLCRPTTAEDIKFIEQQLWRHGCMCMQMQSSGSNREAWAHALQMQISAATSE